MRSRLMEEMSGRVNSVLSQMCGRGGVAGDATMIPAGLRGKYRQAVVGKNGEGSTGSSTSSGEEDGRSKSLEAENKELRARIEALEKKEGEGVQERQGLPSRRESGLEEEWRYGDGP